MLPIGRFGLYTLLVALPVAVETPPDSTGRDRGNTRITAIGGAGTYALITRGCEGQVINSTPYDYREGAGAIEHEFPGGVAFGVRGGAVRQWHEGTVAIPEYNYPYGESTGVIRTEFDNEYIQPTLAIEEKMIGVGVGFIFAREPFIHQGEPADPGPSFHLRIGRRDGVRFELSYMENLPLYSGGGYAELGFGMHPHQKVDFSLAMSTAPFDGLGLGVEVDYRVRSNWSVLGRARLGSSGGESQSGGALGISYSTRPPLPPYRNPKNSKDAGWRGRLDAKPPKGGKPVPAPPAPAPTAAAAVAPLPPDEKYPKYGSYQVLDSLAVPLVRAEPVAPDTVTGTVFVAALVDWNGQVVETRVIKSIPALDQAAIECVSKWTFRPAIGGGRRVASWITIPVRFGE